MAEYTVTPEMVEIKKVTKKLSGRYGPYLQYTESNWHNLSCPLVHLLPHMGLDDV
jgi:hypothetical protein